MTQQYTPVTWQDETTSQQGTLINAERLNQMQTAHHYADGFEEVDAVPAADPSVAYHKIVYCTADSTFYRWDGTEWTKDIDDETKALLQQEIARATEAEGELAQDIADETTARETADTAMQADITAMQSGKLDKKTTGPLQYQIYGVRGSNQIMFDTWGTGHSKVPTYGIEEDLLAKMPTYGLTDDTVVNYGWATAQIGAEATARAEADTALGGRIDTEQARAEAAEQANAQAIANTYTKAETDTLLGAKADQATTYTKTEVDTYLAAKADSTALSALSTRVDTLDAQNVKLTGPQTVGGDKTWTGSQSYTRNYPIYFKSGIIQGTTAPTAGLFDTHMVAWDNSNRSIMNFYNYQNADASQVRIDAIDNIHNKSAYLGIHTDGYTFVNTPGAGAPSNAVATLATLDSYAPMVRTTGNQPIAGIKTLTEFFRKQFSIDITEAHGEVSDNIFQVYDNALHLLGYLYMSIAADNHSSIRIGVRNSDGTMKETTLLSGDHP